MRFFRALHVIQVQFRPTLHPLIIEFYGINALVNKRTGILFTLYHAPVILIYIGLGKGVYFIQSLVLVPIQKPEQKAMIGTDGVQAIIQQEKLVQVSQGAGQEAW